MRPNHFTSSHPCFCINQSVDIQVHRTLHSCERGKKGKEIEADRGCEGGDPDRSPCSSLHTGI